MAKQTLPPAVERRFLPLETAGLELREGDGKTPELDGYAAVFNQETIIADLWREEVAPGAYTKTIQEADIRALFNHDANIVLGRNRAGTLTLSEDSVGLRTLIRPPDSEWGRPVVEAVRRRDVTGMSIAFQAIKAEWFWPDRSSRELPKRTVREARLYDVSPVTYPAFPQTSVNLRALGFETAGDDETDVLVRARQLVRCAQRGLELTNADRELIAAAVDILRSSTPAAEPGRASGADHSAGARAGEPGLIHSSEARARMLDLLRQTL